MRVGAHHQDPRQRVVFRPVTGQVRQLIVGATALEPQRPAAPARKSQGSADVVLF